MKESVNVFVYGSLRKNEQNHYMVQDYTCLATEVWIHGRLFDADLGYPFLIRDKRKKVVGEIYQVPFNKLSKLDAFEDYIPGEKDNLYERVLVDVFGKKKKWSAYVYICNQPQMLVKEIEHGDWSLVKKSEIETTNGLELWEKNKKI
ncbi:gamma-glutamylcyclotransferase family protein [Niallia sp. 03133]|uniref:gamma-glutamylcyclotransferase family protein n=1 Tax=Niallia sp. 03133 TaxID=3458060 RepID=UPI00404422D2